MKGGIRGRPGAWCVRAAVLWGVLALVSVSVAWAWPAGVDHSIFSDEPGQGEEKPGIDLESGESGDGGDGGQSTRAARIVGASLLGSGLFLCSWGIASWEVEEYQCCPAHNTGNVVKIVAGVILINAGLIYLLGAES
jgi:hypothetical protein